MIPGVPHYLTQRGNRRERPFFEAGDDQLYLDLLAQTAPAADGLWRTLHKVHRHDVGYINAQRRVGGASVAGSLWPAAQG